MEDCNSLLYIIFLFLISLLVSYLLNDNREGFENNKVLDYYKIISNPELAGSIDNKYSREYLENNLKNKIPMENYKLLGVDEYRNELINIETGFLPEESKNIVRQFKPRSDAAPYDYILPAEFKRDTPIEIPQSRGKYEINRSTNEEGKDISGGNKTNVNLDSMGNNCLGDWSVWDESHCGDDSHRCGLKYRVYKVQHAAKSGGEKCKYNGESVDDGDIEYDYCFGSKMGRCGIETNSCRCDLDNYSEATCNIEDSNISCICPSGFYRANNGKCEESTCSCNNGTPATGDSCITSGEERCQSCSHTGGSINVLQNDPPICSSGSCNCPYGTPDTGCALPTDVNCESCRPNYKLSTSLERCREYYGEWGLTVTSPVKCCLPDECNISDLDGLDGLNIEKKNDSDECNTDGGDPTLHDCMNSFHCKNGYSFKPSEEYQSDMELKIVKCADDNSTLPFSQPKFNGTCVPVKCGVTELYRGIYAIPDNVLTCDSNKENCGLEDPILCKVPEHSYEESGTVRCIAPHKINHNNSSPVGFLAMSGCQNLTTTIGEELLGLSISSIYS